MNWQFIQDWLMSLGTEYGVNPFIFAVIYIGTIPLFSLSVARLIQNYRRSRSTILPALWAIFFFFSAGIYVVLAGKNVPWSFYAFLTLMLIIGAYSALKKVRGRISEVDELKETATNEVIE